MKSTATATARRARQAGLSSSLTQSQRRRSKRPAAQTAVDSLPLAADLPPRLVAARAGDHAAIHRLLLSIFRGPSPAEFHAQLDEPLYEPTDRLLVKRGDQCVAHLRLTKRVLYFAGLKIPTAGFMDLGTSHEFRSRGFASALLCAGQQQATAEGAWIGLTKTTAPEVFLRQGWSPCGRHSFSVANPRHVLAHFRSRFPDAIPLEPGGEDRQTWSLLPALPPIVVRPLRRIELQAVVQLYDQGALGGYGSLVRSDAWWDWLMSRAAFDRAYVAGLGSSQHDLGAADSPVAGCVFVKEGRIVELLTAPGQERVARCLVSRVCSDCLERNLSRVRIDAPPLDPLHHEFAAAGGTTHHSATHQGETCMARVFDPLDMLRRLEATLWARAKEADLPRPLTLGLDLFHHDADLLQSGRQDVRSYRLVVGQRGVKLTPGNPGRSYLSLRRRDLTPLLLGHWDVAEAIVAGRLQASTRLAQDAAAILFPRLPWYRPPLDDLVA